ncbi:hypothetical protein TNCV_2035441 [Trichonephila clavipes]|nr:hypothetical protein TNCV_2035441 [Trichonephila clavipes]
MGRFRNNFEVYSGVVVIWNGGMKICRQIGYERNCGGFNTKFFMGRHGSWNEFGELFAMMRKTLFAIFLGVFKMVISCCAPDGTAVKGGGLESNVLDSVMARSFLVIEFKYNFHDFFWVSSAATAGAVSPVDIVVREGKVVTGLEVRFLKVNDVWIPFRDKFPEFIHSRSDAVGVSKTPTLGWNYFC